MKTISMDLVCVLNTEELNERAQQMSSASIRYDEVEETKRNTTKELTDELKTLRGTMRRLSDTIRRKQETRPVECFVKFHTPEVGLKRVIRKDTGEIVRDEPMSMDERQNNLFDEISDLNKLYGEGPEKKDGEAAQE
jgi:hypothetical protein